MSLAKKKKSTAPYFFGDDASGQNDAEISLVAGETPDALLSDYDEDYGIGELNFKKKAASEFLLDENWLHVPILIGAILNILLLFSFEFLGPFFMAAYRKSVLETDLNVPFPFIFNSIPLWSTEAQVGLALSVVACALIFVRVGMLARKYSDRKNLNRLLKIMAAVFFFPLSLILLFSVFSTYSFLSGSLAEFFSAVNIGMHASTSWIDISLFSGVLALTCGVVLYVFQMFQIALFPSSTLQIKPNGLAFLSDFYRHVFGARLVPWKDLLAVSMSVHRTRGQMIQIRISDGTKYEFDCQTLRKTVNIAELMNELKANCPEVIDSSCLVKDESVKSEYTELWLKYFSSSVSRNRSAALQAGERVGRYQVAGELGQGGQGTAYLAAFVDSSGNPAEASSQTTASEAEEGVVVSLNSNVATTIVLKEYILPMHRGDEIFQQSLKKLQQEAEILSRIQHPNIVELKDSFVEDHRGYLVLEYVEGVGLKELVHSRGALPEMEVIEIAIQICNALEHMHSLTPAIIHRDLTPDNLILQRGGKVKLVDFNVAHQLESTTNASVVGKHAYIPPEQFRGKPTPQSDIFALGGTLHYLLTGVEPEPLTPSDPRKRKADVSEELALIITKATAIEQNDRYENAFEFRGALYDLARKRNYMLNEHVVARSSASTANEKIKLENEFDSIIR